MRNYPIPPQEKLIEFIHANVSIDQIPITFDHIRSSLKKKESDPDSNPHAIGHFKAINYILKQASKTDLYDDLGWLQKINSTLLLSIANQDAKNLNPVPLLRTTAGSFRTTPKRYANRICPLPNQIPNALGITVAPLKHLNQELLDKLQTPRHLATDDLKTINKTIDTIAKQLLLLQPFQEANNRTVRLAEQLIRLNFQLPWNNPPTNEKARTDYMQDLADTPVPWTESH